MKKKIIIIALWIVTISLSFYVGLKYENSPHEDELENKVESLETEPAIETVPEFNGIVEIPISDIESTVAENQSGITQKEAEQLCYDVLGDEAPENGFPISYQCISAVSANDKLYYVMHIAWLVDNNHWSYIGNCYVSSDGQEIYDGTVSPAQYKMTELKWENNE